MRAGCYQNGLWAVAVAEAGRQEGCDLIGGGVVMAPTGEVLARAAGTGDEGIPARVDLDRCTEIRANVFDFAGHRQPDADGLPIK
ncbi:Carbon-nitrogen hydrolase [Tropicimonas isoalkanivorans]|uniref:Carbon-nitrogen hydrolase n=1 Tax=Tropicimonas isoalkanivorans TaxID=441112 RepID=A0A1I1MAD3_9RHOB|nr:Carbon-nitrogen hydrolase [Tropicimonas isoalkanivorans]